MMMLYYHRDIDDYRNAPGVHTRVPYFGSTKGLLYLDPNLKFITNYMATLVDSLEQIGYEDGRNLFGAPYDFRYGLAAEGHPSQVGTQYLQDVRQLIEAASAASGGKPVILLSHSLGSLFALQLLVRNSLAAPEIHQTPSHTLCTMGWHGSGDAHLRIGIHPRHPHRRPFVSSTRTEELREQSMASTFSQCV